jgi:hypothetical protein
MSRLIALSLVVLAVLSGPAAASAQQYRIGGISCGQGVVWVDPPAAMSPTQDTDFRNPEQVYWTPVLWAWGGNGWLRASDQPRPWYYALTSSYGFYQGTLEGGAWHSPSGNAFGAIPIYVRPGYYGVMNWMYWSWGRNYGSAWSGWCQVT